MKLLTTLTATLSLAFIIAAASGCSSNITNLREQFNPTYQTINVEADERAAFDASLAALVNMGYTITSSGAAQGKIEAISAVVPANSPQSAARQTTASVRFTTAPDSGTAIQILFTEIQDSRRSGASGGFATKQPLANSQLYAVFQNYVAEAMKQQPRHDAP